MIYLTVDEVLHVNERVAGRGQLRDRSLLESAVRRPTTTVAGADAYPTLHDKAAALFHSIASNHAFIDGNKRTAVLSVAILYGLNGFEFDADDADLIHLAVDVAIGNLDVPAIAEHFSKWAVPLPGPSD